MPGGRPWWHGKFAGCGYRLTMPRHVIIDVLSKSSGHLSAEDIYLAVRKIYPGVGLTTVYRTLELFTRMGLVFRFDFGDGRSRYELAEGPDTNHHHHLICTGCGRIIDCGEFIGEEAKVVKQMEQSLSKKHDFQINSRRIRFLGLCGKCKQGFSRLSDNGSKYSKKEVKDYATR